jgi:hypothetical protein
VTSDSAHEGDETFNVTLSNAGGGANVGSPAGATVTMTDDDGGPQAGGVVTGSELPSLDFSLRGRKAQRLRGRTPKLALSATCSADCTLKLSGKVALSRARLSSLTKRQAAAKSLKLRAKTYRLAAGKTTTLRVAISRKMASQILAGLKQGRRVSASLTGAASNPAAPSRTTKVLIRLKR